MATLTKRKLPPGKKIAFSLRWDDANPKHVRQYQAFHSFPLGLPSGSLVGRIILARFQRTVPKLFRIFDERIVDQCRVVRGAAGSLLPAEILFKSRLVRQQDPERDLLLAQKLLD